MYSPYVGLMSQAGPEYDLAGRYDVSRKPKFEKDFIMLSEFSELVGPVPVVSFLRNI